MANMEYCRFTNTTEDLYDCFEHMDDEDLSPDEQRARGVLIRLAVAIALKYGETVGPKVIRADNEQIRSAADATGQTGL